MCQLPAIGLVACDDENRDMEKDNEFGRGNFEL
jgi:hypothetical protein